MASKPKARFDLNQDLRQVRRAAELQKEGLAQRRHSREIAISFVTLVGEHKRLLDARRDLQARRTGAHGIGHLAVPTEWLQPPS